MDRKLVKETTGHASDAVDAYQITSDRQRESLSKIIAADPCKVNEKVVNTEEKLSEDLKLEGRNACVTLENSGRKLITDKKVNVDNVVEIIQNVIDTTKNAGKTVIRLEIEINR